MNQLTVFTAYELMMIKSFATNAIISTRVADRHDAIIAAVMSMIYAKGYMLESLELDLSKINISSKIRKTFETNNLFTIKGEPSGDAIQQILEYIDYHKIFIVKDPNRDPSFKEPVRMLFKEVTTKNNG